MLSKITRAGIKSVSKLGRWKALRSEGKQIQIETVSEGERSTMRITVVDNNLLTYPSGANSKIVMALRRVPAKAERKLDSLKDATLVIWGRVAEVVREETAEVNKFKVKIQAENTERGHFYKDGTAITPKRGRVIWAHCFQRKASTPKKLSAGHKAVPVKGQFIRAFLRQHRYRGKLEGILPNWFHELKLTNDQLAAMKWINAIGSSNLRCDDSLPGRPVTRIYIFKMFDSGVWDEDTKYLTAFPELRSLELHYSHVRHDGLTRIAKLKHLEDLTLSHVQGIINDRDLEPLRICKKLRKLSLLNAGITDLALFRFSQMPSLRSLDLSSTKITDDGLNQLKWHRHLESLDVSRTKITNSGVQHLATMKSLKRLSLEATAITDKSLQALTNLSLVSLDLRSCPVTPAGLMHVAKHKRLQTLNLQSTPTTDAVLKKLSELKDLREIVLQSTRVTDKGLMHLTKCKKLKTVWILRTRITSNGVKQFRRVLPKCYVTRLYIE